MAFIVRRYKGDEPWQPTRAQRVTAWRLADDDGGCLVRSLGDGEDELLTVQKGEYCWYRISEDGEAVLVETYPRSWRYAWGKGLCYGGVFLFFAILLIGGFAFASPSEEFPAFLAIPAVLAGFLAAFGSAISPHVRHVQRPPGEKWAELQRDDNG